MFSAPDGLNKLLEMYFKFPFNLIGKFTIGFLGTYMYSNSGTKLGAQNEVFSAVSQTDLTRSLVPTVVQARGRVPLPTTT